MMNEPFPHTQEDIFTFHLKQFGDCFFDKLLWVKNDKWSSVITYP